MLHIEKYKNNSQKVWEMHLQNLSKEEQSRYDKSYFIKIWQSKRWRNYRKAIKLTWGFV